jgi:hypothetical protein
MDESRDPEYSLALSLYTFELFLLAQKKVTVKFHTTLYDMESKPYCRVFENRLFDNFSKSLHFFVFSSLVE